MTNHDFQYDRVGEIEAAWSGPFRLDESELEWYRAGNADHDPSWADYLDRDLYVNEADEVGWLSFFTTKTVTTWLAGRVARALALAIEANIQDDSRLVDEFFFNTAEIIRLSVLYTIDSRHAESLAVLTEHDEVNSGLSMVQIELFTDCLEKYVSAFPAAYFERISLEFYWKNRREKLTLEAQTRSNA